jgi:hypothetical protein
MRLFKRTTNLLTGLLMAVVSTTLLAEIEFSDAYNFRDFRVNTPLTYTQGNDLLLFGISVIDSDTGTVPEGAIVRARNLVADEEIVLRRDGVEYYEFVPYSSERASGEWIIEVNSDVGSASALITAFGIGSGTGAMPVVENFVNTSTGAQPAFTWTLPAGISAQNDGNVDRLRFRIRDSNDAKILDDRFDDTVTATSYTTPEGIITHNGAFNATAMVEGFEPFNRSRNFVTFVVDDVGVGGEAITLDSVYRARDFRGENSIGWRSGDRFYVCADASPNINTYVYAEQSGLVLQSYPQLDNPEEYCSGMAFDPNYIGSWDIVAWNGENQTIAPSSPLGPVEKLPLVTSIRIEPDNLTPTIRWNLPEGNNVPYDDLQIGLFDDVTNFRLYRFGPNQDELFDHLPTSATSYTFQPGILEEDERYVVRVLLVERDNSGATANRSLTFFNFTPIMQSGVGEIYLPTLDEGGIYNFEFDVTQAVPVTIDPEVAVGYIYEIGDGDPRFSSVTLPQAGDDLYDLTVYNDEGDVIHRSEIAALALFDLASIDANGVSKFEVNGIETSAGLDPLDSTAFMTTLTFSASGRFSGSMTPIVVDIPDIDFVFDQLFAAIRMLKDEKRLKGKEAKHLEKKVKKLEKKFNHSRMKNTCKEARKLTRKIEKLLRGRKPKLDAEGAAELLELVGAVQFIAECEEKGS